jgi:hypothetical protein
VCTGMAVQENVNNDPNDHEPMVHKGE